MKYIFLQQILKNLRLHLVHLSTVSSHIHVFHQCRVLHCTYKVYFIELMYIDNIWVILFHYKQHCKKRSLYIHVLKFSLDIAPLLPISSPLAGPGDFTWHYLRNPCTSLLITSTLFKYRFNNISCNSTLTGLLSPGLPSGSPKCSPGCKSYSLWV